MVFVYLTLSIAHYHLHRVDEKLLRLLMLVRILRSLFRQQKALQMTFDIRLAWQRYLLKIQDALDFGNFFVTVERHLILKI